MLHMWAENCNVTRRVLAIADQSDNRMALAVERFGRLKPERMEIVRVEFVRSARQLSREEFCEQLRRILAEQFPDETLDHVTVAADLEHSLSRVYVRGVSRRGSHSCAFLAVPQGELPDAIESSLTFGLLWLQRARQTAGSGTVSALRLILPKGKSAILAHRLAAIDPRVTIQVFELDALSETLEKVDPCASGNIATWLVPRRESQLLIDRAAGALAPVLELAPQEITVHPSTQDREVVLRFRGLPFARWDDGRVYFDAGGIWEELRKQNEIELRQLVLNLQNFRNPLASETRHPLYRSQSERWLQSIVQQDVNRVDVSLLPEQVYEQVFAHTAAQHGIRDLLGITRAGRLAILELKTTEDLDLPLQAAGYWSRIRRHQQAGDLARYGYFPGVQLQPTPPLVYLIAPALRFHPSTDVLLEFLRPEMEVIRIGLAESWRRGLRVMMRQ
ncbi:MAG TPA: hypothetical protein VGF61_04285 [Candidatus Acidoferrum sp.]